MTQMIELPIDVYAEDIVASVELFPITLIVGDTGSGKSTRVPRFILDSGRTCLVTQPRRLAAVTVAQRVAKEHATPVGDVIGYATRFEKKVSSNTRCLFCTDGLGLVREFLEINNHDILIVDEVHEFNLNIEMLLAWVKLQVEINPNRHVVLMSATVNEWEFQKYFGKKLNIFHVEGRMFPVEDLTTKYVLSSTKEIIEEKVKEGKNILFFLPGKGEISYWMREFHDEDENPLLPAKFFELHGEMFFEEQQRAFQSYGIPKVIFATNVAQTSVTIPGIHVVVDSEQERRVEIKDSVEGLYLRRISRADVEQRKGRAGRVQKGEYISVFQGYEGQLDYPVPEIQRLYLDHVYLKISAAGFDPEEMEFFHEPNLEALIEARHLLILLGCLTRDKKLTKLGAKLEKYPLSVRYSKMLYTADKMGVFDPVLQVVCCLNCQVNFKYPPQGYTSDMELYVNFLSVIDGKSPDELKEMYGLSYKSVKAAKELYNRIYQFEDVGKDNSQIWPRWEDMRDQVEFSILSSMLDELWVSTDSSAFSRCRYRNDGFLPVVKTLYELKKCTGFMEVKPRTINRNTCGSLKNFGVVVGFPLDIKFKNRMGENCELNLLNFVIPFREKWLEWVPDILSVDIEMAYGLGSRSIELSIYVALPFLSNPVCVATEKLAVFSFWYNAQDPKSAREAGDYFEERCSEIQATYPQYLTDEKVSDFREIFREYMIERGKRNHTPVFDPFNPEIKIYTPLTVKEAIRATVSTTLWNDTPRVTKTFGAQSNTVVKTTPAATSQWVDKGKWVTCPNGHTLKLKTALQKDPKVLHCDMCSCTQRLEDMPA